MALKVNPKNLRASNFRIGIMAELGLDTKKYSREDFIIRMKLGENDASYWSMKGSNLFDEKKYKESIKCFDKALKLDSSLWGCKRDKKKALKLLKKGKIRNEIDTFENKEM